MTSITSDSRDVKPGSVFVAVKGNSQDGHLFIQKAVQNGAILAVGEDELTFKPLIPYVLVKDSRKALAHLAAQFYHHPSHQMKVIGVTGTSGKTTTTYLLESIFQSAGKKVGVIGTVNTRYGKKIIPAQLTTPGPIELQKLLSDMRESGCEVIIMEVSSHSLIQSRVGSIAFDAMVFTNLSPEHLDFHKNMANYFAAKSILFSEGVDTSLKAGKTPIAVINIDDSFGRQLVKKMKSRKNKKTKLVTFGMSPSADLSGSKSEIKSTGIFGKTGTTLIQSSLVGHFNSLNLLGAIGVAKNLKISSQAISKGILKLKKIPGRLERVPNSMGIHLLIDYAHKPDALEKVLKSLKGTGAGRLITVFGCGGDRDRLKRPIMGRIACDLSDQVIITSDNPRTENPDRIINEILKGTRGFSNFSVEPDRKKAIYKAISIAKRGDWVLIAGKGHEDYQIIADPTSPGGTQKIHFDDREVAREALG